TDRIEQALKADLIDNKTQNRRLFYTGELPYDPLIIYLGMVRINNLSVKYDSIFTPDPVKGTRHKIDLTYEISYSTLKGSNEMEYSYAIWDNLMPEVTLK
ncbi:MAG: hypothetical protein H7Y18_11550, partial [Clostridiaceae bacterium]|nr:hypothetical protein [Clostridiaceae bacterium]